ncbi:hypothetical protein FCV25MIE_19568 [Fagus crenata]
MASGSPQFMQLPSLGEDWNPLKNYFPMRLAEGLDTSQVIAVEQLMGHGKAGWDEDNLRALFDDETVLAIKNIPRWDLEQEDSWVWCLQLKISPDGI